MEEAAFDVSMVIARELNLASRSVAAVVRLLGEGATVPFIARYRKEATGGLDEVQIRAVQERSAYLKDLEDRRQVVLRTIEEQGKLTDELRAEILACSTKTALEDLYLPYKPKRRNKAVIAIERGLEPLADRIAAQPLDADVANEAQAYVSEEKGVASADKALDGARDILIERMVDDAKVRAELRRRFSEEGILRTWALEGNEGRTKFEDYYDHKEPVSAIPSHRYLAIRRGEAEGVLASAIDIDEESALAWMERHVGLVEASPFAGHLRQAVKDAFRRRLSPSIQSDVRIDLKLRSDAEAVNVFARNVENRLLAAPLGPKRVVGIDPGIRTGSKVVALDETGRFLEYITIFPARGAKDEARARDDLGAFLKKHRPFAVAVGNGTAGRETLALVRGVLRDLPDMGQVVVVSENEAGASVYSASDIARKEFPDLDVSIRGAISIARRLQDPLAELVKIDPKSIGVGQYQHDVDQKLLERKLGEVVESCVNRVGVELNTASASLLKNVAGVGPKLAEKIVSHREENGPFASRKDLLSVKGLGPKVFEQAAGFIRVYDSDNPLDRSAVHPERYELVEQMARDLALSVGELVGNADLVSGIEWKRYLGPDVGEPTLRDILEELARPGRDPRETFEAPSFRDDVQTIEDLQEGMVLDGVVTNVTNFGAFVDVGVHQDGLVHISRLADRFVKDPHEVVKVGDRLKVKVLEVDLERKRIGLSARLDDSGAGRAGRREARGGESGRMEGRSNGAGREGRARGGDGRRSDRRGERRDGRRNGGRGGKERTKGREEFANRPFADLLGRLDR